MVLVTVVTVRPEVKVGVGVVEYEHDPHSYIGAEDLDEVLRHLA